MNTPVIVASAAAAGVAGGTAAIVAVPPDYTGMATLITAVGALIVVVIGAIVNGFIAWGAASAAAKANIKIDELKVNNDGKLTELMTAVKGQERAEGKAEGKQEEKDDQAHRDASAKPAVSELAKPVEVEVVKGAGIETPLKVDHAAPKPRRKAKK